jgi:hypothetical protein
LLLEAPVQVALGHELLGPSVDIIIIIIIIVITTTTPTFPR